MKKLMLVLCVVLAVVLASSLQAAVKGQVRGIDKAEEMNQKIEKMRAQLKAEGHTYEIGWNDAMNYSLEQLCGLKPELASPDDVQVENKESQVDYAAALPAAYSGKCSPIKNQGSCGSCWAFGIIGAIEGQWAKVTGTYYDFSEQYLLDCNTYGYSCSGGFFSAFNDCKCPKYFKWESCYPYVAYKKTCNPVNCDADCVTSWAYVGNSSSVPTTSAIKQKIYDYGCVAAALTCGTAFQAYKSGCFTTNLTGSCNHAIVLCGWNDTTPCSTGGWYLKNSWGTSWGLSGFMWIKYGVSKVGYAACYCTY
jgi:C1A family cysteine protease